MKDVAREVAAAERIERLEAELERARAELSRARGAQSGNRAAYLRRLEEDNAKLREERHRLKGEVTELRGGLRHRLRQRTDEDPITLLESAVGAIVDFFFGRRQDGGGH